MTLDRPAPVVVDEFPRRPAVMRFLAALQSFWGEISTSINAGRLPVGTLTDVAMVVALNAILCVIVLAIVGGVWTVGRKWWASLPER